ncbi:MAG TPA: hypothetical protein VEQ37_12520 [Actinomycetota bacterium]|nr:hypothetical protein [Actinomycetota bacterium]
MWGADGAARVLSLQPIGEVATWALPLRGFNPGSSLDLAGSRGAAEVYDQRTDEASAVAFDRSTGGPPGALSTERLRST